MPLRIEGTENEKARSHERALLFHFDAEAPNKQTTSTQQEPTAC